MWIGVGGKYLPGAGQPFKPGLRYRLRTLRDPKTEVIGVVLPADIEVED